MNYSSPPYPYKLEYKFDNPGVPKEYDQLLKSQASQLRDQLVAWMASVNEEIEGELIKLCMTHGIELYLGEYGNGGRQLVLSEEHAEANYISPVEYPPGSWVYSSAIC